MLKRLSLIPVLGMLCCLYLMIEIPVRSWMFFFGWMAFGLAVYFPVRLLEEQAGSQNCLNSIRTDIKSGRSP